MVEPNPEQMGVSVIIPTMRRPDSLARALRSISMQAGLEAWEKEVIVIDNDADRSAEMIVRELKPILENAGFSVCYTHEPRPGVAQARNHGVALARFDLLAFLDDDQEAPKEWLRALLDAAETLKADATFGRVIGVAPSPAAHLKSAIEAFFSRLGPATTQLIPQGHGCGNSLLRKASLPDPQTPFAPMRDHTGGEDDYLFATMQDRGAIFGWAAQASVFEHIPPSRATLRYLIARNFSYGQGPSSTAAARRPPDWLSLVGWIIVGIGQGSMYGTGALLAWPFSRARSIHLLIRAVRGWGKVFWGKPFKIEFYGRAAQRWENRTGADIGPLSAEK